jgi:hypothetical protein
MDKCTRRLGLCQAALYQIEVVGHLDIEKATWFEGLSLACGYGEDGTPITSMTGEVLDQAALHGLLTVIRDLGLPLLAVSRVEPVKEDVSDVG